ncbi:MAG: DinB family protein [Pikeienuella sp.]
MNLLRTYATAQARNNRWANATLLGACKRLTDTSFCENRGGFFGSIAGTANHILMVDHYYIDALVEGGRGRDVYADYTEFDRADLLADAQAESDERLIAFCEGLSEADFSRLVVTDRGEKGAPQETIRALLPHLFQHQVHHRGQIHGLLSQTHVAPPQLDDFFLEFERAADARFES